jgi:hypothetical protein
MRMAAYAPAATSVISSCSEESKKAMNELAVLYPQLIQANKPKAPKRKATTLYVILLKPPCGHPHDHS